MKSFPEIKTRRMEDSITIYWEKPEFAGNCQYELLLDGKRRGSTDKTHYTFEGLTADREYEIEVRAYAPGEDVILSRETKKISTLPAKRRIDVTLAPYCAKGDGSTLNTECLQHAIDDCGENEAVYFPAGIYKTGALRLHSNMELYVDKGAILQGTDEPEDYLPRIWSRFEGTELECYSSLLNIGELNYREGYNCENVMIRGGGTIASGGVTLAKRIIRTERERLKDYLAGLGDKIKECETKDTIPGRVRPRLINISNCKNVTLSNLTLKDGASWNVHMIYSDDIVTFGCTFYSKDVWNGDGWDPDSSTNCTLFDCMFFTGDDSVAIKSGKNPEGNEINRPCEHIWVFDSKCAFGHGIAIGSEISGGIRDVKIWDCDMSDSLSGIEIKATKKRGGYVENVQVKDCAVCRVMFHSVGYNDDGIGADTPPVFKNCSFRGMEIKGKCHDIHEKCWKDCDAIELKGFDEKGYELSNIVFEDVVLGTKGEEREQRLSLRLCENVTFKNICCI